MWMRSTGQGSTEEDDRPTSRISTHQALKTSGDNVHHHHHHQSGYNAAASSSSSLGHHPYSSNNELIPGGHTSSHQSRDSRNEVRTMSDAAAGSKGIDRLQLETTIRPHHAAVVQIPDHLSKTPANSKLLKPGPTSPFSTPAAANTVFSAAAGIKSVFLPHDGGSGTIKNSSRNATTAGASEGENGKSAVHLSPINSSLSLLPIQSTSTTRSAASLRPELSGTGGEGGGATFTSAGGGGGGGSASKANALRGELSRVSALEAAVERAERAVMAAEKKPSAGANMQRIISVPLTASSNDVSTVHILFSLHC
jgi:hypothetical protein